MPENFVYVRILQVKGDARSDANDSGRSARMKKSPSDERAGWISVVIGLKLLDDLLGKFGGFRNYINGNARFQQVPCDFLRLLPCRAVFPIRLVNVLHHVAEHISGTKITQFYLVLQYP